MPRRSHRRDYRQEYLSRQERARALDLTGYAQERRARLQIIGGLKREQKPIPSPLTKAGRAEWNVLLGQPKQWKEGPKGRILEGGRGYGAATRFTRPDVQWDDDSPRVEYRGAFMTRSEAVEYTQSIARSVHVLVAVAYTDDQGREYAEVWLDTISD